MHFSLWEILTNWKQTSAATCTDTQQLNDKHKSDLYYVNNKQRDNVINTLCLVRLQTKMYDSQTVRAIHFRAQTAQRHVTLSRHTAWSLAISIRRKRGFLSLIMTILIIIYAWY